MRTIQHKRFLLLLLIGSFILTTYAQNGETIRIAEFMNRPFGVCPTIENLKQQKNPRLKLQRYRFKRYESDTIYRFYRGKNQLFFNKNQHEEIFMSAHIQSRRFPFIGGIHIGMKKDDFLNTFTEPIPGTDKDTITFRSADHPNNYSFIFKRNRLQAIRIDNKKD